MNIEATSWSKLCQWTVVNDSLAVTRISKSFCSQLTAPWVELWRRSLSCEVVPELESLPALSSLLVQSADPPPHWVTTNDNGIADDMGELVR